MDKVKFNIVGIDGNSFAIIGAWKTAAKKQNFTPQYIQEVIEESMSGDYRHFLRTILDNSTDQR